MATKQVASSRQQQQGHAFEIQRQDLMPCPFYFPKISLCSCRVHAVDSRQGIVYTVETPDMFRIIASHHLHLPPLKNQPCLVRAQKKISLQSY